MVPHPFAPGPRFILLLLLSFRRPIRAALTVPPTANYNATDSSSASAGRFSLLFPPDSQPAVADANSEASQGVAVRRHVVAVTTWLPPPAGIRQSSGHTAATSDVPLDRREFFHVHQDVSGEALAIEKDGASTRANSRYIGSTLQHQHGESW
jgi:hypothetical protein